MVTFWEKLKYSPVYMFSLLPFWAVYMVADFCYILLFYVFGYRKKVVYGNLKKSFPEKSEKEINQIAKKFYRHFASTFLESIKLLSLSKEKAKKRYKIVNPELMAKFYKEGKSMIMYGAHFGNWEWASVVPLYVDFQFASFYQRQSSGYFDRLMVINRSIYGNICVESQSGFKYLLTSSKKGIKTFTYVIGDQSPMTKSSKHWTTFLNQETAFLVGAEKMAKKIGLGIVYPKVTRPKRGYYKIEYVEIDVEHETLSPTDQYAQLLEENIKAQPELWLWSHRRWKLKKS